MHYVIKPTSELRTGDIVNCHGMRCLIDGEVKVSLTHPDDRGTVHYARALVLNRDEVSTAVVPLGFTTADKSRRRCRGRAPLDDPGQRSCPLARSRRRARKRPLGHQPKEEP